MKYLLLLLISSSLFASTQIVYKKGGVFVDDKPAVKGQELSNGQVVRVEKSSLAVIKFGKKATIKLDENSRLLIEKRSDSPKEQTSLILKAGSLFSKVLKKSKIGKPIFKVKVRSAVLGVRGTEFFTAFSPGDNAKDLWMCVNEGSVEVASNKKSVIVKSGEGIFIKNGKSLTKPKPYSWTKKLNWNLNPNEGKLENKVMKDLYTDLLDQDYD